MLCIVYAGGAPSQGFAVEPAGQHAAKVVYVCPMHPQITSDHKGSCPICGMDLVLKETASEAQGSPSGVLVNTDKQQLIGVRRGVVQRRQLALEIATAGKIADDPGLYSGQVEYLQEIKTASVKWRNGSRTLVYVTVYEYELGLIKKGQEVRIDAVAFPGEVFKGNVAGLRPIINTTSRTARAKVQVEDKEGKLKPGMFVNATIRVDLGEQLAVPEEAVMDSGTRKIVYVVRDNRFAAREVTLGPRAGQFYQVLSGLHEGEEVVTSGNFLIDAESRLKNAL